MDINYKNPLLDDDDEEEYGGVVPVPAVSMFDDLLDDEPEVDGLLVAGSGLDDLLPEIDFDLLGDNGLLDPGSGFNKVVELVDASVDDDDIFPDIDIHGSALLLPNSSSRNSAMYDYDDSGRVESVRSYDNSDSDYDDSEDDSDYDNSEDDSDDDVVVEPVASVVDSVGSGWSGGKSLVSTDLLSEPYDSSDDYDDDDDFEDDDDLDAVDSILEASSRNFSNYDLDDDYDDMDSMGGFDMDEVIATAIDVGASDVHVTSDSVVSFTILGDIVHVDKFGVVPYQIVQRAYTNITSNVAQSTFAEHLELDTSYMVNTGRHKGRRTRVSVGRTFNHVYMVLRVISDIIPTPEELGVSKVIQSWTDLPNGLVLICGPTNTGKTTTFASMVGKIQKERPVKIMAIERPIEYVYGTNGRALITQREVGQDTRSFKNAMDTAMRNAPNIILIGEVRNRVEFDALLYAADSGHLALSTMHTNSAATTLSRIKSLYEGHEQASVLDSLAGSLQGIANQVLVKSIDEKSRFAIQSVLNVTPEVTEYISKGDSAGIDAYMKREGLTMEHALVAAVKEGKCTLKEARSKSASPFLFDEIAALHKLS